jgi:S1-C subfamily serine protease
VRRRTVLAVLAAVAGGAGLSACGSGGDGDGGDTAADVRTVETRTRVEVLRGGGGGARGGFDPEEVFRRDGPGVVTIIAAGLAGDGGDGTGLGSGFVVSRSGEIATNAHVVTSGEGDALRRAREVFVRFGSGDQVPGRIVGVDPFSDVALLRVDPEGLDLRPLELGTTEDLVVGAPVAAIGSPFGEERSLSVGVVSALDRDIESLTGFRTSGAIQTDAAINSGNSGGPLLDAAGRVLGINSQIRTRAGDGTGVGFAVPADTVRQSLEQLRATGRVRYPYLGVSTRAVYPQLADRFGLRVERGAWVQEVVPDGPGDDAGVRAGRGRAVFQESEYVPGGDVITKVEGRELERDSDLGLALLRFRPGQTVSLELVRDGQRRQVDVRLGLRPAALPGG